jgi:hypothetical protein
MTFLQHHILVFHAKYFHGINSISRVREKPTVIWLVKKYLTSYGDQRSVTAFTKAWSLS